MRATRLLAARRPSLGPRAAVSLRASAPSREPNASQSARNWLLNGQICIHTMTLLRVLAPTGTVIQIPASLNGVLGEYIKKAPEWRHGQPRIAARLGRNPFWPTIWLAGSRCGLTVNLCALPLHSGHIGALEARLGGAVLAAHNCAPHAKMYPIVAALFCAPRLAAALCCSHV